MILGTLTPATAQAELALTCPTGEAMAAIIEGAELTASTATTCEYTSNSTSPAATIIFAASEDPGTLEAARAVYDAKYAGIASAESPLPFAALGDGAFGLQEFQTRDIWWQISDGVIGHVESEGNFAEMFPTDEALAQAALLFASSVTGTTAATPSASASATASAQ